MTLSTKTRIGVILRDDFKSLKELEWCVKVEEILDEILEGVVMRKQELEREEKR